MKKLIIPALIFVLALSGCAQLAENLKPAKDDSVRERWRQNGLPDDVSKFRDTEDGVTCWLINGYREQSISCIKFNP